MINQESDAYYVLAYYIFTAIENPHEEVKRHHKFFKGRDASSRIYISEEGINGQMSASKDDAIAYMDWMHSDERFKDVYFKTHHHHENAFPRLTIKYREQLVALDKAVDMDLGGKHASPQQWKEMLESDEDYLLIDVRNDYEWKVGHFEGAELPQHNTFREFDEYADKLKQKHKAKDTKVMMYCTGGIRCEVYSALMKEKGFNDVYQLDGGVINYGSKEGGKHWNGKLFVFDDRLTVPISEDSTPVVGKCHYCETPIEDYYNCANADCNELFLSCKDCLKEHIGCCQNECKQSTKLRSCSDQHPHKPFRRLSWEEKQAAKAKQIAATQS